MRHNLTDIIVILDRSGSMNSIASDAVGGLNHFVAEQKKCRGEANFTMVQFDNEYEVVHPTCDIKTVGTIKLEPRGSTALLDAIGRTINETGKRLSDMPQQDRPGKVLVVIMTDGLENASREFSRGQIFGMIKHQQDAYKWEFLFMGCNQDAILVGQNLGIPLANAMSLGSTGEAIRLAFRAILDGRPESYRTTGVQSGYEDTDREVQIARGAVQSSPKPKT